MEIRPILSAMLRNKAGVLLVALQIAVTLAVVVNASFIIKQRLDLINRPTGMDVENIFTILSWSFGDGPDFRERIRADLDLIRNLPGVVDATTTVSAPLSGGGSSTNFLVEPGEQDPDYANYFPVDEHAIETLGVNLVAGRDFRQDEVKVLGRDTSEFVDSVIMTQAFANRLFPDGDALGKTIYDGLGQPATIVGIIEHMHGSWVGSDRLPEVVLFPAYQEFGFVRYVIRAEPGRRDELMPLVEQKLAELDAQRVVREPRSLEEYAANSYRAHRMMATLLGAVIFLLVSVTALGIVGLASFSVKSRTKQIGTRRAIGASRLDILRYFMVENWLITTGGVVLGSVLAVAFNYWLVRTFELPKLDWIYVPIGIVALWILGQLAVLGPARRAAAIPPAIATRTV